MAQDVIEQKEIGVTYPYQDIADGFGQVDHYLSSYEDSVGKTYRIGRDLRYSSDITYAYPHTNATTTLTFDTPVFANPKFIEGQLLFNFCLSSQKHATETIYFQIKVYHYDGSTATQLGSTWQSATMYLSDPAGCRALNAEINVARKKFKEGDRIRVEVIAVHTLSTLTGTDWCEIGIDPQNRTTTRFDPSSYDSAFTQFVMLVPYKNFI